MHSHYIIF